MSAVSAFAKRKATQSQLQQVTQYADGAPAVIQPLELEVETPSRLAKRRKRGKNSKPVQARPEPSSKAQDASDGEGSRRAQFSYTDDPEEQSEDVTSDLETQSQIVVPARKLSKFSSRSTTLSESSSTWTARLYPTDNLAILGQYDLWVHSGAVSIFGAVIHASSRIHRVYAPSTHSLPSIRPVPNPFGSGNPSCEISITSCASRIRSLSKIAPKLGRIWNGSHLDTKIRRSFVNIENSEDDPYKRPLRLMETPPEWQTTVSKFVSSDQRQIAVMVCGPKGAGKSTFCRTLVNAFLRNPSAKHQQSRNAQGSDGVAFLDLDPGQPEYSPPGEMSLLKLRSFNLGPPLTHPTRNENDQLVEAHHYGYLSPKEDPAHYYNCALDLFSHYKGMSVANKNEYPLIVNCSGWIQGGGVELLVRLIHDLDLTDIVYMSTTGPEEVIEELEAAAASSKAHPHKLPSQATELTTRTAADMRMMQALSYFHLDELERDNLRWNPSPLNSIPPLVVHYAGPRQGLYAVMVVGDAQSPDFLESILEGCIVGVVAIDDDLIIREEKIPESHMLNEPEDEMDIDRDASSAKNPPSTPSIQRTATGIPYITPQHHTVHPLPPSRTHSLGQALIHSIHPRTQTFHLQTPIPPSTLQTLTRKHQRIIFVRGKLDTPTWAYAEQFEYEKASRRRREVKLGVKKEYGAEDVKRWAEGHPWASVVDGGRSGSGRVRRVRRDIRYRGQKEGAVSE